MPHGQGGRMNAAEREMARSLVAQLGKNEFDASKFEDEADQAMRKLIAAHEPAEEKSANGHGRKKSKTKGEAQVVDLLESLRASLTKGHSPRQTSRRGRATRERPYAARSARSSSTRPRTRAHAR